MAKTKEVAVVEENNALAAWGGADELPTGFEHSRPEDVAKPWIGILQGLSKAIETVEGAKPGIIMNSVTQELYREGVDFLAVRYRREFVRQKPNMGAIVTTYPDEKHPVVAALLAKQAAFGALKTEDGDEVKEKYFVDGIVLDNDLRAVSPAQMSFSSASLKKFRQWHTQQQLAFHNFSLKMAMVAWHLGSVKETSRAGKEFYNWSITPARDGNVRASVVTDPATIALIKSIASSKFTVNYETETQATTAGGDEQM